MKFLEELRNRREARRREHEQEEAEELAAAARGEGHSLREQKDAMRDELGPRERIRIPKP
jgi:hypothetical protein